MRSNRLVRNCLRPALWLALAGWFALGTRAAAQDAKQDFWLHEELQKPAAAAQLVAGYHPVTIWPIYRYQRWWVWLLPDEVEDQPVPFDGKLAPSLNPRLLASLGQLDKRPVPQRADSRVERNFVQLYREAIINAAKVPKEAFAEWAEDFKHLTWAHLYREPHRHYGKMITVEGKLLLLRKIDAPPSLQDRDIPFIYEGWVQGPTRGANPFAIHFVHPAANVKVAENYKTPPHVKFYGYFLGRYRYRGGEGKDFDTALLVGPTVETTPEPPAEPPAAAASPLTYLVLYGIIGVVCLVTVLMVGLNWWFRKGDQEVRNRLAQIQAERAVETLERGEPFPESAVPPHPGANGENNRTTDHTDEHG